jgi:Ca-activated chloride channel homolog
LEVKVGNFFTKVNSPVLTGLDLNFGSVKTDLVYPRKTPDIFRGTQLTMIGRYKNDSDLKNITLKLTGKTGKEMRTFNYDNLSFPMRAEDNNFLPRLWATRRVGWLMEQIRNNGETKEVRDEIVDLGTRFGIVTPYTSYLATDGSEVNSTNGSVGNTINQRQIQNLPTAKRRVMSGRGSGNGSAPRPMATPSATVDVTSGAEAVKSSKDRKAKNETVTITSDDDEIIKLDSVQKVGAKTFYLDNGVWVDGEFKAESKLPEIKLQFASNEYFDLAAKEKDLAQYLALGEEVVIVWKGKVYRIIK